MLRKAIIIILSVLTLGTGYAMVASFITKSPWALRTVVDTQATVVLFNAHSGSAIFFFGRSEFSPSSPTSELPIKHPLSSKDAREMRRAMIAWNVLADPIFRRGSNATRLGLVLPSRAIKMPAALISTIGYAVFPLWCPLLIFAAYPMIAFIRGPLRGWRRARKGQCKNCGYDLTGNISGVCSECGEET